MLASLWSHRQPGAKHKQSPRSGISFACLLLLVVAVSQEIRYGLLSTSNGRIVSFLKSVHMVNYYWPKARLSARSLLGCTLLKFVGSSLISFALGEGLLIASPRHLLSFVCAWSLVRSDSVEATQLSRLLRHSVRLHPHPTQTQTLTLTLWRGDVPPGRPQGTPLVLTRTQTLALWLTRCRSTCCSTSQRPSTSCASSASWSPRAASSAACRPSSSAPPPLARPISS